MADVELVIKIPEEVRVAITRMGLLRIPDEMQKKVDRAIQRGTPLPKGHGDLFDKIEILRFLKCPDYENCDWKNCFDCNKSCCINLNNVNGLVPILAADKTE